MSICVCLFCTFDKLSVVALFACCHRRRPTAHLDHLFLLMKLIWALREARAEDAPYLTV